jgi:hypothetical protein
MSPFDWRGQPSIFTTAKDRANYTGLNHEKALRASVNGKLSPISLPGGSKNLPPHVMRTPYREKPRDVLRSGGELGAKNAQR